ncbi:MAG: hypothetical protein MZW92_23720 [Comamonadaceae bacterium]|nr:hypothetical protein [Comamonadaceae bacterium]
METLSRRAGHEDSGRGCASASIGSWAGRRGDRRAERLYDRLEGCFGGERVRRLREVRQPCHAAEYKTWQDTLPRKMVRTPKDGLLKDAGDNWAKDSKGNAGPTKANIDGAPAKLEDVRLRGRLAAGSSASW